MVLHFDCHTASDDIQYIHIFSCRLTQECGMFELSAGWFEKETVGDQQTLKKIIGHAGARPHFHLRAALPRMWKCTGNYTFGLGQSSRDLCQNYLASHGLT